MAAFTQACREAGIPEHLNGRCPARPCPCQDDAVCEQVEARALQLTAERLGVDVADLGWYA